VNAEAEALHRPIQRADLEAKMRELQGEAEETYQSATNTVVTIAAVAVVAVVAVAYLFGRRKGKKRTTLVEIHRL
jgi:hypothetical protein